MVTNSLPLRYQHVIAIPFPSHTGSMRNPKEIKNLEADLTVTFWEACFKQHSERETEKEREGEGEGDILGEASDR